ncbi:hypothetical protein [Roseovarius sp. M141]|nr:hypothetical protein [Roseovarius sp. M141]
MPKQPGFPGFRDAMKKQTRRELFLAEMCETACEIDPLGWVMSE